MLIDAAKRVIHASSTASPSQRRLRVDVWWWPSPPPASPASPSSSGRDLDFSRAACTLQTLRNLGVYDGAILRLSTTPEHDAYYVGGDEAGDAGSPEPPTGRTLVEVRAADEADDGGSRTASTSAASDFEDDVIYLSHDAAFDIGLHHDLVAGAILDRGAGGGECGGAIIEVLAEEWSEERLKACFESECPAEVVLAKVANPSLDAFPAYETLSPDESSEDGVVFRSEDIAGVSVAAFFEKPRYAEVGRLLRVPYAETAGGGGAGTARAESGDEAFYAKVVSATPSLDGKREGPFVIRPSSSSKLVFQGTVPSPVPPFWGKRESLDRVRRTLVENAAARKLFAMLMPAFDDRIVRSPKVSVLVVSMRQRECARARPADDRRVPRGKG